MQERKFHLQDVHYAELRKGLNRSSPEVEVNIRPRKVTRAGDNSFSLTCSNLGLESEEYVKEECKFVDDTAGAQSRETFRKSTSPSTRSKRPTPSLDWNADLAESGLETVSSSTYKDGLEKDRSKTSYWSDKPIHRI